MLKGLAYYGAAVVLMLLIFGLWALAQAASVNLAWDNPPSTTATSNRVYQLQATDCTNLALFTKAVEVPMPAATATVPTLTEGLTYCFVVKAANAGGESDPSNTLVYTVPVSRPPAPRNLRVQ